MSKKMLINASHPEEHRAVIVEDGALTELEIESVGRELTRGNIYKAVVVRVETGLQAAFVDYGADRLGFLQMGEIHPLCYRNNDSGDSKGRPRINDVLHRGQELLVQVVKEERGTKGAALTTFLSLPGRYMVLMPESDTKGVSRKIEEEAERKKLKNAMASMNLAENMGYIVRTAGIGQPKEELKRDFDYLLRVYQNIQELAKRTKAPALVYKESNLVIRMIRDYFNADIDEVLVDDPKVFQEAKDFFQQVMPEYAKLVKLHQEKRPIFSRYQIEEQIETINKNKVPLPSGGSIVIDSTEALVAIDVNSGKMASEQGVEATAYKTNLEAAAEVGRQLRLRDLGGLIVIDFIDMRDRKHTREVEKVLKDALKMDKARVTIGHISSQFGLLEMSRQRIKATLSEGAFLSCPHCDGSGRIKSTEAQAVAFLRKLQSGISKGQIGTAEAEVPHDVATYLLNTRREELLLMERQHRLSIVIKGRGDLKSGQFELSFLKREKEELIPEYVESSLLPAAMSEESVPAAEEERQTADLPAATEDAGEESGKKKRKRRRRKKKNGASAETPTGDESAAAEEDSDEEDEEEGLSSDVSSDQPQEASETSTESAEDQDSEAPGQEEAKPAKKRRRRRKKSSSSGGAAAPAADSPAAEASVATDSGGSAIVSEPTPAPLGEEPPKKPTRRRGKKPTAKAAAGQESHPEVTAAEPPVAQPPAADPPTEAARKPRAPRKRATAEAVETAAPEIPAEKPKPARKPRAGKAQGEPAAETTETQPPKRRAPRKKASEPPAED